MRSRSSSRTRIRLLRTATSSTSGSIARRDDGLYRDRIGDIPGVVALMCGGATRGETVRNGLAAMAGYAEADDWVAVHDAARPCVDMATLNRLSEALADDPIGGLLAVPL